jgi:acetoin utilization deacetylase AcuC-like enzyme
VEADTPRNPNPLELFYSPAYVAAACEFDTTRKAAAIAASLDADPIDGVALKTPALLTEEQIARVHDPQYVHAVRTGEPRVLAESSGLEWDPGLWDAVCASNGGTVAAALRAFRCRTNAGSLSSGLHHAHRESGGGFCTFNGLALAVDALRTEGARRILIVDLDAHMGGGTASLVRNLPGVVHVDISVARGVDAYSPSPAQSLDIVSAADDYLPAIRRALQWVERRAFDVCLYNAGMDAHEDCSVGGLRGVTTELLRQREESLFDWAARRHLPVAFVLAGGYVSARLTQERLVKLHRLTIAAAADRCEQRGPCGELYSIGDDGLPHDEWLHAELLGNEDDDPFAYDFDEFVNMSRDEQEEFLRKRETGWTDKRDDTK